MAMAESMQSGGTTEGQPAPRTKGAGTVATLELMRGLASLDVFLWHLLNSDCGMPKIPGLYRVVGWSRESVIVFFVLSGYVIALSQQRLHRAALPFFKARVKRIEPLYLIALGAAIVTGYVVAEPCSLWQIIGHLFFLQSYEGSFVAPLPTNGPLWSLGTEFEFYGTLVLILALRKPALIYLWWALHGPRQLRCGGFGAGVPRHQPVLAARLPLRRIRLAVQPLPDLRPHAVPDGPHGFLLGLRDSPR
jgi:peptidoglycan/LPS O-acetylase OafA/YrhL